MIDIRDSAVLLFGSVTSVVAYVVLRLPYEVKDLFREWLAEHHPQRASHVMSLIQDVRGGRDNDPDFPPLPLPNIWR